MGFVGWTLTGRHLEKRALASCLGSWSVSLVAAATWWAKESSAAPERTQLMKPAQRQVVRVQASCRVQEQEREQATSHHRPDR
jgi:hypothetical protein